jgi:hypothetical protein
MYADGTYYEEVVRWWVYRDRRAEGKDLKFVYGVHAKEGDSPYGWVRTYEWNQDPGDYLVMAEIRKRGSAGEPEVAILSQHVMSKEEVKGELAQLITKTRANAPANPDGAVSLIGEQLRTRFNKKLKSQVVTHGAQDDWDERLSKIYKPKANINYGPQPPVVVYVDGEAKELGTWKKMKEFCHEHGINIEAEYASIDWDFWREMRTKSGKGTE